MVYVAWTLAALTWIPKLQSEDCESGTRRTGGRVRTFLSPS
jgi:hypothetical protein